MQKCIKMKVVVVQTMGAQLLHREEAVCFGRSLEEEEVHRETCQVFAVVVILALVVWSLAVAWIQVVEGILV